MTVMIFRPWRAAEALEVRQAGHRAVDRMISQSTPAGYRPARLREVNRRLGLAGAHQHAALAGAQREDVARHDVVVWLGDFGSMSTCDGAGAVGGGDAGSDAGARLDRDREGVPKCDELSPLVTIIGMPSSSARSAVIGMQIRPRPYLAMKLIGSARARTRPP